MGRVRIMLLVGVVIISTLFGCRAMTNDGTQGTVASQPPAPTETPNTPTPPPSPAASPSTQTNIADNKEVSDVLILREALGEKLLTLIDGHTMTLQKVTSVNTSTPNIIIEDGKLLFDQTIQGKGGGLGTIHASGTYQKLGTASGEGVLLVKSTIIDFNFNKLQITSACYGTTTLTGGVRCTLNGTYNYGTRTLTGSGQCMTHTEGNIDNLRIEIGGEFRKMRYVLGFKVQGDPADWRAYQWAGTAYAQGVTIDITHLSDSTYTCNN